MTRTYSHHEQRFFTAERGWHDEWPSDRGALAREARAPGAAARACRSVPDPTACCWFACTGVVRAGAALAARPVHTRHGDLQCVACASAERPGGHCGARALGDRTR